MSVARARSPKSTPVALIEAAERLFGTHGIENVSLRQVRIEAGAANNSAVTYHFADRESLVRAIWEYRLPALDRQRRIMVDDARAHGRERDPHVVMRMLVLPNYELRDAHGIHRYAAFFRYALRWHQGTVIRNDLQHSTPASREALALLLALAPAIPPDLLFMRLRHGSCAFFDMIAERDEDQLAGRPVLAEAAFLAEGIDMLVAICLRPALS